MFDSSGAWGSLGYAALRPEREPFCRSVREREWDSADSDTGNRLHQFPILRLGSNRSLRLRYVPNQHRRTAGHEYDPDHNAGFVVYLANYSRARRWGILYVR